MRIGWPGHAWLSLVRQSPLLRGRFSFHDEAGGSSPPRPTTGLTSGNAASVSGVRWRGVCRIKNSCPVTVARPQPDGHEPRVSARQNQWMRASPRFASVHLPLSFLWLGQGCRTALGDASSLLAMTSRSVAANTTSWISQNAGHPQADEIASFDQTPLAEHGPGLISRPPWGEASCWPWCWAASGKGCRQTRSGPTYPPRRARSRRSLPEAALTG
jgi:hypothetical protein